MRLSFQNTVVAVKRSHKIFFVLSDINYNYLDLLNPQQREAVIYKEGPALVIAGAGSGKTRVLTYKIADLLYSGYEPYRIMALTFTNKAAREMKERISTTVDPKLAARLWAGTFHSIFLRILRTHADVIGFKPGFTIYDTTDSKSLIKMIIKEMVLDEKIYKPSAVLSAISNAKNAMISPEQYSRHKDLMEMDRRAKRPLTAQIYAQYAERCHRANAMDFDDILYYMNLLLRDNPDIRRHYQQFFRYILVDEYQDTNFAQHMIVSQLIGEDGHLCVVGDDAQSIYSFRGANIGNIINLEKRYPGLRTFKLERNYRSTQTIVNAAGSLIAKNTCQIPKNTYSENEAGKPIEIVRAFSDIEEGYLVANFISLQKTAEGSSLNDFAILYRTNAQSRVLEEALRKRGINYRIYGGLSFYQRKEIKDMIAYFRLTINPDDDEALRRIINFPARGIGETTMKKLQAAASENGRSLWETICTLEENNCGLNAGTRKKLNDFGSMIQSFIDKNNSGDALETAEMIYSRTGILASLAHDNTPESISRKENLEELISGLKDFVEAGQEDADDKDLSLRGFLSEVMLATDQDSKEETDEPKVTLMTAHAAKGLEFKHIYIVGVEEDLFPSSMSMDSLAQIEEERRLLYVAITRAKSTCTISYAGSRFRNGQTMLTRPSRFLSEIDPRYLRQVGSASIPSDDPTEKFINPAANYHRNNSYSSARSGYSSQYGNTGSNAGSYSTGSSGYNNGTSINNSGQKLRRVSTSSASGVSATQPQHSIGELSVGTKIRHPKLGTGVITAIGNMQGEPTIAVDFDLSGSKKLLLKFAKFEVIK